MFKLYFYRFLPQDSLIKREGKLYVDIQVYYKFKDLIRLECRGKIIFKYTSTPSLML